MKDWLERADALIDLHRPEQALELAQAAMARAPQDPAPHLIAARAHLAAGSYDDAEQAARQALSLDPLSSHAARLIAIALGNTRDQKGARKWALEAVRLAPEDTYAHALLAQLLSNSDRHRDAIAHAEQAVSLDPENDFAHFTLGRVLYQDGRFLASEHALRHALALDPTDAPTLSALGETLAARGRPEDAAELLQLAARADVRDESIHQDMLRYVRRAAAGLATWPIIGFFCLITFTAAIEHGRSTTTLERLVYPPLFALIALGLYLARRRRLHRFPPEARRLLNRRSRTFEAFEWEGPSGLRPWWWLLIVRIPLTVRALAFWLVWLFVLSSPLQPDIHWRTTDWVVALVFGVVPITLTCRWVLGRRKAVAPHALYPV